MLDGILSRRVAHVREAVREDVDLVFHTIAPYAVERERFLAHCGEEGFSKVALRRIAGIVVTAACDLHAHGGLDVDQERLEAAAGRIEVTRRQAGVRDDAREYRREFLRVTTRWVLFLGRLQPQAVSPRPVRRTARRLRAVDDRGARALARHVENPALACPPIPRLAP